MKHKANELVVGTRYWLDNAKQFSGVYKKVGEGILRFTDLKGNPGGFILGEDGDLGLTNFFNLPYEVYSDERTN